ncbi:DUF4365 domain-containing protein [Flavobacterium sp. C3NV]|uniref:DUF4365 domain-containing protein n=1 Tax=Flavobacterium sp. C3NV TaxID=3393358 RepID=UPI0039902A60
MDLPIYNKSSKKGEDGITILKKIIEKDLNWIFRPNHKENDFGIDAYLDIIAEFGQVTGKTIAAQVKTGPSYFKEKNDFGWIYRGEVSHLNYYLNHDIPVIIIIIDDSLNKAYWCLCDPSKTEQAGGNWKITIPYKNELQENSKPELLKYISPIRDYASQLEHFWKVNKQIKKHDYIIFIVDRPDIENKTFQSLLQGLERLHVNQELITHTKEKIDICIHGYNEDSRELHEIPEFKEWLDKVVDSINGWAYFLSKSKTSQFLKLMQICNMKFKVIEENCINDYGLPGKRIEIDFESGLPFIDKLFIDLNIFTEKHQIPIEVNKEISSNLIKYLTGKVI